MKQKICFLFLLLTMVIIKAIRAENSCEIGMREMYLNQTTATGEGSAKNYIPSINFYEGKGSLWYMRKILIEPRFEIHLKANLKFSEITEKREEQVSEGLAIIISKNKIRSISDNYLLYYGLSKSYIIEFIFNKNQEKPEEIYYSLKYCDLECSNDDLFSGKLENIKFELNKIIEFDFKFIYEDKEFILYSGQDRIKHTNLVNIESTFEANTSYIGFTGYMNDKSIELNLSGTFVCEDNFDISKIDGKFYINNKYYDTYSYEAGEKIRYAFSFINSKGQIIPHYYQQNIWNYSLSISTDYNTNNSEIIIKDKSTFLLNINDCNLPGNYTIGISESFYGLNLERKFMIIPGPLKLIKLIGHDGIKDISKTKLENAVIKLLFGEDEGNFLLKGEKLEIILDFEITDIFGNVIDIGTNSEEMIFKSEFIKNKNSASLSMKKFEEHYQLIITVNETGTYKLYKNTYMKESIEFVVNDCKTNSFYCTLEGYSYNLSFNQGDKVFYNCYFKDENGNDINIETIKELYDFSCEVKIFFSTLETYTITAEEKGSYYQCELTLNEKGVYQFYGYLHFKGKTTTITINDKISRIYILGEILPLNNAKIFNYYSKEWINIDNSRIEYRNDKNGMITALDLMDSNDNLISTYRSYPDDFNASTIKIEFYSEHDSSYNLGEYYAKIFTYEGIQYIGIFNKEGIESDKYIKRSSFDYYLKLSFKSSSKIITFKFNSQTLNISPYTTCFHDFDASKTYFHIEHTIETKNLNKEIKIGTFELRTADSYLYNYDIGIENIKVIFGNSGNFNYRIESLAIIGTYEIFVNFTTIYNGNIRIRIKSYEISKGYRLTVTSYDYYYIEFKYSEDFKLIKNEENEFFYEYNCDYFFENIFFQFKLLAENKVLISIDDYYINYAEIYYIIDGSLYNDKNKYEITYNENESYYTFCDKLKNGNNNYTWLIYFKGGYKQSKYYISYNKQINNKRVSQQYSYFEIVNNEIDINNYAYVDVYLKDTEDQFIRISESKLYELKDKIIVKSGESIFDYKQITSNYAIRYKFFFYVSSLFIINVYYKDDNILCLNRNEIYVKPPHFLLEQSELMYDNRQLYTYTNVIIDNECQTPIFNLILYNSEGKKIIDHLNYDFSLILNDAEGKVNIEFDANKTIKNIEFTLKTEHSELFKTLNGIHNLTLSSGSQTVYWVLQLLGNSNSSDIRYDLDQTYIEPTDIVALPGEKIEITIYLRGKDGLKWNYVDWDFQWALILENSYGLQRNEGIKYRVDVIYNIYGKVFLSIIQDVITENGENILTIRKEDV